MFTTERGKSLGKFGRSRDTRYVRRFLSRPLSTIGPCTDTRPIYVSFVSKAIIWERGVRASVHNDHAVTNHNHQLCSRFMSHMKVHSEDFKPPCCPSSKSKPLPLSPEKPCARPPTAGKTQNLEDLKTTTRQRDFRQDPVERKSVVCPYLSSSTPLPKIKPRRRVTSGSAKPQENETSTTHAMPQTSFPEVEDIVFKKAEASPLYTGSTTTDSLIKFCPTEQALPQSSHSLCQSSLSDLSRPTSLFSRSLDLSGRSSILSNKSLDEPQSTSPEGIIGPSLVHSSHVPQSPTAPCHAPLPLYSPTNLSTSSVISTMLNGQANAPSLPSTSAVSLWETHENWTHVQESAQAEAQAGLSHNITPHSAMSSSRVGPLQLSANTSSLKLSPSPVCSQGSLWPVLPPIAKVQEWRDTAACFSSEVSCSESQVFDELDAIAPLSASSSSLDELSNSSYSESKDTDVSPGLAALTVNCYSGNLGSLSRVQLLLLNRQEPDAASLFSLDEDNYPDLAMNNGVWRPLTAGSISEKCGSIGKAHQNKPDDLEECSGSPSSWIIDPSPLHDMLNSSQCHSSRLGSSEDEEDTFDRQSSYDDAFSTIKTTGEDQFRKREERKTKVLKILSKLQDSTHQPTSCKSHSNFEDFDFLAKYCIFNQEKLAAYKRAFEEEDTDGDGYISFLQVMFALKSIIPPELLSEEEEIYVYRILEMVDFRVTDGLVDLRLFAVIASLGQKIATMDEFMRSLISSIDFRSLEVKLFKAKKLFLFLLEEQASDGMSEQRYISPEQLILELKAGGICLEQEAAIRVELQHIPPLDLLDFLAYLPLFMLIHKSVIANPLDDLCH